MRSGGRNRDSGGIGTATAGVRGTAVKVVTVKEIQIVSTGVSVAAAGVCAAAVTGSDDGAATGMGRVWT